MRRTNGMSALEKASEKITINGVTMSMVEYKKMLKDKKNADKPKTKKAKAEKKDISEQQEKCESIIKELTLLKSLCAFNDHAYRQWGTIANTIFSVKGIRTNFTKIRIAVSDVEKLMADIEKLSKRNEKSVFQYIEKLTWKLDDIKTALNSLSKYVNESGVCVQFRNHECINGKGRRLGLQTLIGRSYKAISKIDDSIIKLNKIVEDGVDVFKYDSHLSLAARRRVGL